MHINSEITMAVFAFSKSRMLFILSQCSLFIPLKTLENQRFLMFSGLSKEKNGKEWVKTKKLASKKMLIIANNELFKTKN